MPCTRVPVLTSTPAAARAAVARSPWARPRGTLLQPMSAASLSVRRPVWNTLAAMAREASPAARLTVGMVIRSQMAAMAAGDWPPDCTATVVAECSLVQGRVVEAEAAQPRHGPSQPQAVGYRQVGEAQQ